jgi:hypothetical protein
MKLGNRFVIAEIFSILCREYLRGGRNCVVDSVLDYVLPFLYHNEAQGYTHISTSHTQFSLPTVNSSFFER